MNLMKRNSMMFPSLMNEMFKPDWFGGMDNYSGNFPAVNIQDNEKEFVLELAIPGQKKEDFDIEVDNHVLSISMEQKEENEVKEDNFTRKEFSYSSFRRAFTLPETVNEDGIEAKYEDGILRFVLPKKEEALPKPKRMIEIGK